MSGCQGMHCGGCGHHGGHHGGGAVAALVLLVIVGALGDPATRHVLSEAVNILVITAVSAVAFAVAVGVAAIVIRIRRGRADRAAVGYVVMSPPGRARMDSSARPGVAPPSRAELPPARVIPAEVVARAPARQRRSWRWS
jgi:hypothetical protein